MTTYAVMKVARIGCECGANVSTFSCSSCLGRRALVQWLAMPMLLVGFAPRFTPAAARSRHSCVGSVAWAGVRASDARCRQGYLNGCWLCLTAVRCCTEVKSAVIANAQSKVLIVEFHQPIAARVLEEAQKRGALPYPVSAAEVKSRRYFIAFPERSARQIRNSNIVRFALTRIAAVKRRCCGFCVRVLPVFNHCE